MKTTQEVQERLDRLELRLADLYTRQDNNPTSETINERVATHEARINMLKWVLNN